MKKMIEKLAKGEVAYEQPVLSISETKIETQIPMGTIHHGSFMITSESDNLQGFLYSTNSKVTVFQNDFVGRKSEVSYQVDLNGMRPQDKAEGQFEIVSNAGEVQIPFVFENVYRSLDSSLGHLHNLFHFANLVQSASEEAEKIFVRDDFSDIFIKNDIQIRNVYAVLSKEPNIRSAMEQFLIAVNKKHPIRLSIQQSEKKYKDFTDNYSDTLKVIKSTWGYLEFTVESDADFIVIEKSKVTTDQFAGNVYELTYLLDKKKLHIGKNYGRITLTSDNDQITFDIQVDNYTVGILDKRQYRDKDRIAKQKATYRIIKSYLDFRMGRMDAKNWAEQMNGILEKARALDEKDLYLQLFQAQVYLSQGRDEDCKEVLDHMREQVLSNMCSNAKLYCYFMYVCSLYKQDAQFSKDVVSIITKHYENGNDYWQLLWLLFYTDREYDKNSSIKLARIKAQFHNGCKSPIMYYEACRIMNEQPVLLRVINDFELQVINFGCKYHIIGEKMAEQICTLLQNAKTISKSYLRILKKLYSQFQTERILNLLCTYMIRDELYGKMYFPVYEAGIRKGLRITRLYEFYMLSIDEKKMEPLPKILLMYFAYNSQLGYEKKAYLYANIIVNKEKDAQTYTSYHKQIELFALDQLHKGNVDSNLSIVYKDIWDQSLITRETVDTISKIMFSYRIECKNSAMKFCIIKHKESIAEEKIILVNGNAFASIFTENYFVAFEDENGGRRADVTYTVTPLFEDRPSVTVLFDCNRNNINLAMYLCEKNFQYQRRSCDTIIVQNILLMNSLIEKPYKREITHNIIDLYYTDYEGKDFVQRFSQIDTAVLCERDAANLAEICIENDMYEDAYNLVILYGFEKIAPKKVMRLCRKIIKKIDSAYNYLVTQMCYFAFSHRKYDNEILIYLVKHFNQSTKVMLEILYAADNFGVDTREIQERILAQLLFSANTSEILPEVFEKYYDKGARQLLTAAYLGYISYLYFVKGKLLDDKCFEIIEEKQQYGEEQPDVCRLALLLHLSQMPNIRLEQKKLIESELEELFHKGYFFKFYENLKEKARLPVAIANKTFIEYRTTPDTSVTITYRIGENGKECVESMQEVFEGIYVMIVDLFYGEECIYRIEKNREYSKEYRLVCNNVEHNDNPNRYDYLNDMLASRELDDIITLKKLMHGYCVQNYVVDKIFKPLK